MYQGLLRESRLFDLLLRCDRDLAAETRRRGCGCGGPLHSACYPRKPRGGPPDLGPDHAIRFSYCCGREGCRRRLTPASLRFLGRRVFFGVVVVLAAAARQGSRPSKLGRLCAELAVSVRTLRRWIRWWRETFPASRFWREARGRLSRPAASDALPSALIEAFVGAADVMQRLLSALRFMGPVTTGAGHVC